MTPKASVIIPVYNAVRDLELVLSGFSRQTFTDFELIVADDGSGPEMRDYIQKFSVNTPFAFRSVYHPDEGFRRSKILNSAVRQSTTDYLVFTDGDCIPHRRFVQVHWERRAARTVLVGRRVNLSRRITDTLTPDHVRAGWLEKMRLAKLREILLGRGSHWDEGILLNNAWLRRLLDPSTPSLLGSVCSLEKTLFEEINGFNEEFVSYGGEDVEFECRLRFAGARFEWVRHQAIQYHLYHEQKVVAPANLDLVERTKALGSPRCSKGLRNLGTL